MDEYCWRKTSLLSNVSKCASGCFAFLLEIRPKLKTESQNYCQLDGFSRRQHSRQNLHCTSHYPDLGSSSSELCFLPCICSHTLFMWDLMLTVVISSVWSQGSLIPKLCYRSSLQPEGNAPLYCLNAWNNGASCKTPHFIVCALHWVGL